MSKWKRLCTNSMQVSVRSLHFSYRLMILFVQLGLCRYCSCESAVFDPSCHCWKFEIWLWQSFIFTKNQDYSMSCWLKGIILLPNGVSVYYSMCCTPMYILPLNVSSQCTGHISSPQIAKSGSYWIGFLRAELVNVIRSSFLCWECLLCVTCIPKVHWCSALFCRGTHSTWQNELYCTH